MKLNKVLALALSGVMAVSMLAGCKVDGKDDSSSSDAVVVPTNDTVSVMNDEQDLVKFEADADFDAMVAAAAKKATYAVVNGTDYTLTQAGTGDAVYNELAKKIPSGDTIQTDTMTFASNNNPGSKTNKTVLFRIESNGLTEKAALEQVAGKMEDTQYPKIVANSGARYEVSYTGKVSLVSVEVADGGKTATAYYIAVSVTQTVAREATV